MELTNYRLLQGVTGELHLFPKYKVGDTSSHVLKKNCKCNPKEDSITLGTEKVIVILHTVT